jgi:hypothetical protein
MTTRSQAGIFMPNPRYANVATTKKDPGMPTSVCATLRDPAWHAAMQEEFDALQRNNTWMLVPRPANAHIITGKWIFRNKLRPDGTLERRKAR